MINNLPHYEYTIELGKNFYDSGVLDVTLQNALDQDKNKTVYYNMVFLREFLTLAGYLTPTLKYKDETYILPSGKLAWLHGKRYPSNFKLPLNLKGTDMETSLKIMDEVAQQFLNSPHWTNIKNPHGIYEADELRIEDQMPQSKEPGYTRTLYKFTNEHKDEILLYYTAPRLC